MDSTHYYNPQGEDILDEKYSHLLKRLAKWQTISDRDPCGCGRVLDSIRFRT